MYSVYHKKAIKWVNRPNVWITISYKYKEVNYKEHMYRKRILPDKNSSNFVKIGLKFGDLSQTYVCSSPGFHSKKNLFECKYELFLHSIFQDKT